MDGSPLAKGDGRVVLPADNLTPISSDGLKRGRRQPSAVMFAQTLQRRLNYLPLAFED